MNIEIDISSEEAEEILIALMRRAKQPNNTAGFMALALAIRLNNIFETSFGWIKFDRIKGYRG